LQKIKETAIQVVSQVPLPPEIEEASITLQKKSVPKEPALQVSQLPLQDITNTNSARNILKEPVSQETALQVVSQVLLQSTRKSNEDISVERYSERFREAYTDYREEEKLLGSTDIWTMQQFHDLVWVLTGFE